MNQAWSVVLTVVGITGLFLVSSGRWQGWAIGIAAQVMWLAYALVSIQWAFIASALVYGLVNIRGLRRQLRASSQVETDRSDSQCCAHCSLRAPTTE